MQIKCVCRMHNMHGDIHLSVRDNIFLSESTAMMSLL